MKRTGLAMVLLLMCAAVARADGFYLGAGGGASFMQDSTLYNPEISSNALVMSFDPGYMFNAVAGYRWMILRFEGEFVYQKNDVDSISGPNSTYSRDGDVTGIGGLANAWVDLATDSIVSVYIGGGVGFMNVKISNPAISVNDSQFAWQVGTGLGFALTQQLTLDVGFRLLATSDLEYNGKKVEYFTSNIRAGLRFEF